MGFTGEELKTFLRKKKITQEIVAKSYNTTRQTIGLYFKQAEPPQEFINFVVREYGYPKDGQFSNAAEIGQLSGGEIEANRSGNEFVDLGAGQMLMIVPLVEDYAQAGYTSGFSDDHFIGDLPKHSIVVSQRHKGKYRAFRVSGESMNDNTGRAIMDNDIATGRSIDRAHWNSRFHLHKFTDYIIVHKEGILIKTIVEHNVEDGIIVCESRNPDKEKYPNYALNLDDVYEIFNVVAVDRPWS